MPEDKIQTVKEKAKKESEHIPLERFGERRAAPVVCADDCAAAAARARDRSGAP